MADTTNNPQPNQNSDQTIQGVGQPQIVVLQQPSNQPAAPTEGLLQPKEGEQVFYIVNGVEVDPDGNPVGKGKGSK